MPCMCGDPYCLSCGPAQGYNPFTLPAEEFLSDLADAALSEVHYHASLWDAEAMQRIVDKLITYPQVLAALKHAAENGAQDHGTITWDERDPDEDGEDEDYEGLVSMWDVTPQPKRNDR